jgi:hypothetical protein
MLVFRNLVNTTGTPGMATQQAQHRYPASLNNAMAFYRNNRVGGTSWIEAAMIAQPWTEQVTIATN